MELNDLYNVPDEQMYDAAMANMPTEIKLKVEEMFKNKYGLDLIENLLERQTKEGLPIEVFDNVIRGLRWKYIQLMQANDK